MSIRRSTRDSSADCWVMTSPLSVRLSSLDEHPSTDGDKQPKQRQFTLQWLSQESEYFPRSALAEAVHGDAAEQEFGQGGGEQQVIWLPWLDHAHPTDRG
ncbi:hypothetical protein GCM10009555_045110 [Acrocarpospora macrocephala]|uniref:Uncharacterized protein n=1 Tax=Acrocarpospora macrocephala TaxID=150177 RepID=A0A5M3WCN9_9ACTN|nr:hypothetical protein Amac_004220 [Acrocarpospora macrocephala]